MSQSEIQDEITKLQNELESIDSKIKNEVNPKNLNEFDKQRSKIKTRLLTLTSYLDASR